MPAAVQDTTKVAGCEAVLLRQAPVWVVPLPFRHFLGGPLVVGGHREVGTWNGELAASKQTEMIASHNSFCLKAG